MMTEHVHSIWREQDDATPLHREAMRLLLVALRNLNSDRLEGVLKAPASHTPERIRDSVTVWLRNTARAAPLTHSDVANPELILVALDLLEARLWQLGAQSQKKNDSVSSIEIPLPAWEGPAPLPAGHPELLDVVKQRGDPHPKIINRLRMDWQNPLLSSCLLISLLVTRSGLCSDVLLASALVTLASDATIRLGAGWYWIDMDVSLDGSVHRRRVFLDPMTVSSWCWARGGIVDALKGKDGSTRIKEARQLARHAYSALCARLEPERKTVVRLAGLMEGTAARIHLESVPLLASYAQGQLRSSSLQETAWTRLMGLQPRQPGNSDAAVEKDRVSMEGAPSGSIREQAMAGDLETGTDSLVAQLREATDPHRAGKSCRLAELCQSLPTGTTAHLVTDWLRYLAEDARNKGKRLAMSTVHYYRGAIANRILTLFPLTMEGISADELSDLYAELVDTTESAVLRGRLRDLVGRFHAYGKQTGRLPDDRATFPKGSGATYEVSARIVTEADYDRALKLLDSPVYDEASLVRRMEARVFLVLGFRFGLRRAEILGLTLADSSEGDRESVLVIRQNEARGLKTSNARRIFPLAMLSKEESGMVRRLWNRREWPGLPLESQYLFFDSLASARQGIADHPAAALALQSLREVTGDRALHAHHLRHSFATLQLIGTLAADVPDGKQALLPHWVHQASLRAPSFHKRYRAMVGRIAMRGTMVSMAMGHGTDEVTYEHYVHGLDVLVHAVLTEPGRIRRQQKQRRHLAKQPPVPANAEMQWIGALFGMADTSRPPNKQFAPWLIQQAHGHGVTIEALAALEDEAAKELIPTLEWALEQADLRSLDGFPLELSSRASVQQLFALLRRQSNLDIASLRHLLDLLLGKPSTAGWSCMRSEDVVTICEYVDQLLRPVLALQFRGVHWVGRSRKTERLQDDDLKKWLVRPDARIDVRICDPRVGNDAKRQRTTRTVTWCLHAIRRWLAVAAHSKLTSASALD
jgi:integrase